MEIKIEIPREFEAQFNNDKFKDSLERIRADIQYGLECSEVRMSGLYELELIQMLQNAMTKSRAVLEGGI